MPKFWKVRAWFGHWIGKLITLAIAIGLIFGLLYAMRSILPVWNYISGEMGPRH